MDRISTYRQITLTLSESPAGLRGAVFARDVRAGRVRDRLIARNIRLDGVHVDDVANIPDVLARAVQALSSGDYTPPR